MNLYCKPFGASLIVVATHGDDQVVPASAYGAGVIILPYAGDLPDLARVGEAPSPGLQDTRPYLAPTPSLDAVKAALKAEIDGEAERYRLQLITPGAGQAMEYQETQRQAVEALAAAVVDGTPSDDDYPMLAASVGLDVDPDTDLPATDVFGVARSVLAARDLWMQTGAAIRRARLSAKAAVEAADTIEGATAARDAVVWPA